MSNKSRTEYSAVNTSVAVAARVIAILTGYATRVIFTHTLSESFVGLNGLFTDILNILSLSELGIGTAITRALYRPIAGDDIEKQKSLMLLYKAMYRIIAVVVLVAGLCVIPFMNLLIKGGSSIPHVTLIYLMYLFNSVLSYLLVYKKTLIDAHQLSYIGVLCQTAFLLLQYFAQILFLLTTRNFLLYVLSMILCTLGNNLWISRKAEKMYPYLQDKTIQPLSPNEKKGIFADIRAMMLHKMGNIMVNNTDNLLLSSLVGLISVSCYSNYYLIIGSIRQVLNQLFQGITASVGNLGVQTNRPQVRKIFEASFFAGQWVFGFASICIFQVVDAFVALSFGDQYVFEKNVTLILCLNFYLTGMRQATLVFRDSMGLYRYDRYKSILEAVINLVLSFALGRTLGAAGVFIGTLVSTVTTSLWVEPYVLYKHYLKCSSRPYFLRYCLYASVTLLLGLAVDRLCSGISGPLLVIILSRLVLCTVLVNAVYLVLYHSTAEFRLLWEKGRELLLRRTQG